MSGVEYAVADDINIAYRIVDPVCENPRDVVLVPGGFMPIEILDEEPGFARLLDGLAGIGRVIVFDRRGVGLSDPIFDWGEPVLDQWAEDLAAVVAATGARDVVVVGIEGFGVASRFVARHPELVSRFVSYEPMIVPEDSWDAFRDERLESISANIRGENDLLDRMAPSRAGDPAFRDWYHRAGRLGASPATARRIWESVWRSHPHDQLLDEIAVPTLVLHRRGNQLVPDGAMAYAADLIPDATLVEVDGVDGFAFAGDVDSLVAEISQFVLGERRVPPPDRLLAAVMFTDLVGSTSRAAALGDAQWKAVLERHDSTVRTAVGQCGGTVVKTTGDGVLATFPSVNASVNAAQRLRARLAAQDLDTRIGIHVGDIDRRGEDVSGLAVNIAARVMALAGDGEIAMTAAVTGAMAGEAVEFESRGEHDLKGVPGPWEIFRLV